jgi:hypothetical protein
VVLSASGSAVVLKNVTEKSIATFGVACFTYTGKRYEITNSFDQISSSVEPGGSYSDWAMDATPLNSCRSQHQLLGVEYVKFFDQTIWTTKLKRKPNQETK